MTKSRTWTAATLALGLLALGADDELQSIEAGGLRFTVPKAWKASKPERPGMRLMQFRVEPAEGDEKPAELVMTALRGGGGGLEANLDRWRKQFQTDEGGPAEIASDTRKVNDLEVIFAEAAGRYVAAVTPGSPEKFDEPNWRLLGAIVQADGVGYYLKMVGPEKTVKAAKPAFEAMIKTIEAKP